MGENRNLKMASFLTNEKPPSSVGTGATGTATPNTTKEKEAAASAFPITDLPSSGSGSVSIAPDATSNDENGEPIPEDGERTIKGFRWFLVCLAIYSANILYGLDTTIVADIQGAVSETYDNVTQLGWLGVGFTLGSTVAILPLGKAFGIFDNKWIFIACLTMFAAASALCGAAPSMNAMIVGRVWAGAGGAGMYLGTLNLSTLLSSPKEQPFYIGLTGFVYGSGCILGPIVGGALADSAATWRWAFYLNLLIFGAFAPVYLFLIPPLPRRPDIPLKQKVKAIDWLGTILTAAMYVSFTIAFSFGGVIWPWSNGGVIALIVVFAVSTVAFCVTQYYSVFTTKLDRLFPCDLLKDPQLVLLYLCMAGGGASLFVSVYYIPLYFLFVEGDSGVEAAVRLLPYICFYVATILTCGAIMGRTGYHNVWYLLSGLFMVAGGAAMYTVHRGTSTAAINGYTVLLGMGMATSQAGYAVGNLLVKPDRVAEMIQFLNISQGQSQLIALAIASAIFQTQTFSGLKEILAGEGYADEEIRAAIAGARSAVLENASPEVRERCVDVIVESISKIWILVIAAGVLYSICSLGLTRTRFVNGKKAIHSPA
ncbi:major facilitator superfamily domain-containing protein [Podospora australis]|uniref:Major facilitator superfamily domain-containing protein n=1 Tax=Podospora australis TaxID=1536484 RepID=A0AAN6WUT8_9PEZI|nr:major facilitator superfamily domain-containing protein [Podospora australis]